MTQKIPIVAPVEAYRAYRAELEAAVTRVLDGGWYILGAEVEAFESAFAEWGGMPHMVGVANGTDAIESALRTLEIGPGDTVLTVSHTAVATVAAIELVGAIPVLVDIDPATFTIDPAKVDATRGALRAAGDRPRAVIAVHLYGHPCDVAALAGICDRHGVALIEDCAQAHGATVGGRHVGSFGEAATFSFYPTKNLGAFGDGGATAFHSADLAARCRALREYGWHERYLSDIQGMNSRLDELHAAMLRVRLQHLDAEVARRRSVAAIYDAGLRGLLATPAVRAGCAHAYHLYVVRSPERDRLKEQLAERGIGTGIHYPMAVHQQRAYADRIAIGQGGLAETERAIREVLSLPMHGLLADSDAEQVVKAVRNIVSGE